MTRGLLPALALLALPPAIVATQKQIDAAKPQVFHEERLAVWSGDAIRKLLPGLEQVMADVYWLRSVQYFGGERAYHRGSHFPLLEPLIRITVDLDPRLLLAYRYGATFLAEPWPSGAGRPKAAEALLQRGIEANPHTWELFWDLGTIRYLFLSDSEGAAAVLMQGARIPNAPGWLESLAARMLSDSNQRETARSIWQQIFEEHEGAMKENARANLQYLDAADVLDRLEERLAAYRETHGGWPPSLAAVAGSGRESLPTADATGVSFDYNPESGRVAISRGSMLWSLVPEKER